MNGNYQTAKISGNWLVSWWSSGTSHRRWCWLTDAPEGDAGDISQEENIDSNDSDADVSEDEEENFHLELSFRNSNLRFAI